MALNNITFNTKSSNTRTKKRTQHWVFTLNNYTDETIPQYKESVHEYMIYGREVSSTGTPHLQGYVKFKVNKMMSAVIKALPGAHVEPMYSTPADCIKYCQKDGDYEEFGTVPETRAEVASKKMKRNWDEAYELAKAGRIEDIPKGMLTQYYAAYRRIQQDNPIVPDDLENVCGVWLYGNTGVGKSHTARARYPGIFDKPLNKWWDGYRNEDAVLLDDVDHSTAKWIGHFLKRWADKFAFPAEIKGYTRHIRPKTIVVTSQYTIEELFAEDTPLQAALLRRFKVETITRKRVEKEVEPRRIIREKYCDICRSEPCNCFAEDHNNKNYL